MDPGNDHRASVERLGGAFAAANTRFIARLRGVDDAEAERRPSREAWSAAEIGWHVAKVTTWFAGLISGDLPGGEALPADFHERSWAEIASTIPDRLQAPSRVHPPPGVTRAEAIAALEASGLRMATAFDALTAERGARHGITSPIVGGAITLYQVGEWATAHVIRHNKQAKQLLGR